MIKLTLITQIQSQVWMNVTTQLKATYTLSAQYSKWRKGEKSS